MHKKLSSAQSRVLREMTCLHDGILDVRGNKRCYGWVYPYDVGMKWNTQQALLSRGYIEESTKFATNRALRVTDNGRIALAGG